METSTQATEQACQELLKYLTDSSEQLMTAIAPNGWQNSPYKFIFHPTAQQVYEKSLRIHENLKAWMTQAGKALDAPVLTDIEKELAEDPKPIKPYEEFLEVLGSCLWCIFSNNHDVIDENGTVYHLGSFRGSGSFIADFLNEYFPSEVIFDYMDFYCADVSLLEDDTVFSLLVLLFERLKNARFNWRYSFPRIGIVSFEKPEQVTQPEDYDPQQALEEELTRQQRREEVAKLQAQLDEAYEKEREEALYQPPPLIIRAYQTVYGHFSEGWVEYS
ncbi:MAG: hypothetical protein LCH91_28465 [Bacteroidetes bacterium]|nr:hypothetical protein [Bacteroidota bacterium]